MQTNGHLSRKLFGGDSTYESAVLACGRLDAVVATASPTARHLLLLRAALVASSSGGSDLVANSDRSGMIALLRPDGEGGSEPALVRDALIAGAARLQGGAMPTLSLLQSLLGEPLLRDPDLIPLDAILRDAEQATPPLVKGIIAAGALRHRGPASAALAFSLIVRSSGVIAEGWLSIPRATLDRVSGEGNDEGNGEANGEATGEANGEADVWPATALAALGAEARAVRQALDRLRAQLATDEARLREELGRAAWSALDLLSLLQREPVIAIPQAAQLLGHTVPTAGAAIARLTSLGMARELTGRGRDRLWAYSPALVLLAPE